MVPFPSPAPLLAALCEGRKPGFWKRLGAFEAWLCCLPACGLSKCLISCLSFQSCEGRSNSWVTLFRAYQISTSLLFSGFVLSTFLFRCYSLLSVLPSVGGVSKTQPYYMQPGLNKDMGHPISFLSINYPLFSIHIGKRGTLVWFLRKGLLKRLPSPDSESLCQLHNLIMIATDYVGSLVRLRLDFTKIRVYFYIP